MNALQLALGALASSFAGIYFGSSLLGLLGIFAATLSLAHQGHPLGTLLGISGPPDRVEAEFRQSRDGKPHQLIVSYIDPLPFTDFFFTYDPSEVGFSAYMVQITTPNGFYAGKNPTVIRSNKGSPDPTNPHKLRISALQNYSRPSDKRTHVNKIVFVFFLDPVDTSNLPKFKNLLQKGQFVKVGGTAYYKVPSALWNAPPAGLF